MTSLDAEKVFWKEEEINWKQTPVWLRKTSTFIITQDTIKPWIQVGKRKECIDDETYYCEKEILDRILSSKSVFDDLSTKEFLSARQRSNPFETIKGVIFQNRAAMKMANIDAAFDWMFTNFREIKTKDALLSSNEVLFFADICAGPGGFSEYVLWRKKWTAKGFGFTLKDTPSGSDFNLDEFLSAPCETFDPHYGVNGYDGDGDIMKTENIEAFRDYVLERTDGRGVHFVMADGGISVEGQENIQELLTKRLVLCQYACALSILSLGGHFVCKVFDMFTPFSVGLFYLLYCCFEKICIFKPVTSRPANSERYIVGMQLNKTSRTVCEYLLQINEQLSLLDPGEDILHVVPAHILDQDESFTSYVTSFNNSFGLNQTKNLEKIKYYVKNPSLQEKRQATVRLSCLQLWKIPDEPRVVPMNRDRLEYFNSLMKEVSTKSDVSLDLSVLISSNFHSIELNNLEFLKDAHSLRWCWACGKRMLLLGMGRNQVFGWDMISTQPKFSNISKEWQGLELPQGTIIEVECLPEMFGEGPGQVKRGTVYIVDVIVIYNEVVGHRPFKERQELAKILCKVLNKPCRKSTVLLRAKPFHRAYDVPKHFNRLCMKNCKGQGMSIVSHVDDDWFVIVKGMQFLKHINDPWHLHLSKKGHFFYFNSVTGESTYNCPATSVSPYLKMASSRRLWVFNNSVIENFQQYGVAHPDPHKESFLTIALFRTHLMQH